MTTAVLAPARPDATGPPAGTRPAGPRPGVRPPRRPHRRRIAPVDLSPSARLADAERLAALVGLLHVEAVAGRIAVRRLRPLLTPRAEQRVAATALRAHAARRDGAARPRTTARVRRVVLQRQGDRYEAVTLVDDGHRTVAVCSVLHATRRGWVVSDLARPDDGLPSLPPPVVRESPGPYRAW